MPCKPVNDRICSNPECPHHVQLGKANVIQEGTDLTLVSFGAMMRPTLQAAEEIQKAKGVSLEIIDLLTIAPLDGNTIVESVKKTGRCVVVQEAPRTLGIASEIIAIITDKALLYLEAPVKRVTGYDVVTPYFGRENMYLPSPESILKAIDETIDFR